MRTVCSHGALQVALSRFSGLCATQSAIREKVALLDGRDFGLEGHQRVAPSPPQADSL